MLLSLLRSIAIGGTNTALTMHHRRAFVGGLLDAGLVRALTILVAGTQKASATASEAMFQLESSANEGMGDWDGDIVARGYSPRERRHLAHRMDMLRRVSVE